MRQLFVLVGLSFGLVACDQGYDAQVGDMKEYFKKNKIGDGSEFMLTKSSSLGPSDVAVVFGYMDDGAGCNDIARLLNAEYPNATYFCSPMN